MVDFRATRENQHSSFCGFLLGASAENSEQAWVAVAHDCKRLSYFRLPPRAPYCFSVSPQRWNPL